MKSGQQAQAERVARLLAVVERARDERCAEIMERARLESAQILKQAWQKARGRLHQEIMHARARFAHQLRVEQAGDEVRRRQARQQADRRLLDESGQLLRDALVARWRTPAARKLWIDTVIEQALDRLRSTDWRIEHPGDWSAQEREALGQRLTERLGAAPVFHSDTSLPAGIRVCAGSTVVDGGCDGLLHDRVRIEARLLAIVREIERG